MTSLLAIRLLFLALFAGLVLVLACLQGGAVAPKPDECKEPSVAFKVDNGDIKLFYCKRGQWEPSRIIEPQCQEEEGKTCL